MISDRFIILCRPTGCVVFEMHPGDEEHRTRASVKVRGFMLRAPIFAPPYSAKQIQHLKHGRFEPS